MKLEFDPAADAAYFEISPTEVETTKEIEPGIIADYDADGHLVGIEILSVSKRAPRAALGQSGVKSPTDHPVLPPAHRGRIEGESLSTTHNL